MRHHHWLILCFLWIGLPEKGMTQGWGDWMDVTHLGTRIENSRIHLKNGTELAHPERWYFYKDHIIGKAEKYFIIDEQTATWQLFQHKKDWQTAIEQQQLHPKLWTRWYTHEWHFFDDNLMLMFLPIFPVLFLLFGLALWNLYRVIWKENFNIRKPSTLILVLTILLIWIRHILDSHPGSI